VTRAEFEGSADVLKLKVDKTTIELEPREFKTGSLGWYAKDRIPMMVNGKKVLCMAQFQLVAIGSKEV